MSIVSDVRKPGERTLARSVARRNSNRAVPAQVVASSQDDDCYREASRYLELGFSVIPLKHNSKRAEARWKKYQSKLASSQEAFDWFSRTEFGCGIVLGDVSGGLACRDFDREASYHAWACEFPHLARCLPTVKTPRGFHVYFLLRRPETEIRLGLGKRESKGAIELGDGELRIGSGCYCAAPPTQIDGHAYVWLHPLFNSIPPLDPVACGLSRSWCSSPVKSAARLETVASNTPPDSSGNTCNPCFPCVAAGDEELIIQACLPTGEGQRHRKLFDLARCMRSLDGAWDINPRMFKDVFRRWLLLATPNIRTKCPDVNWGEFLQGWECVKHRLGDEPIRDAWSQALQRPIPRCAQLYGGRVATQRLIALCAELQRRASGGSFYLGTRIAGELLGVDYTTVSRLLKALCGDGVLTLVQRGVHRSGRASEFRFMVGIE